VYDLFPARIAERRRSTDQTIMRTRSPITLEETVEQAGEEHFLLASAFPLIDKYGTLFAVAWIETDCR